MNHEPHDYWAAPKAEPVDPVFLAPMTRPSAVTCFNVYAVLMALLYFGLAALMVVAFLLSRNDPDMSNDERFDMQIVGVVFAVIGVPLGVVFAAAPFLPRRPWVWVYDLVLIILGLTSCITWPLTIPLLIYWLKAETKWWFGQV